MAEKVSHLLELPIDILLLILPYLDAPSFLHLTATCKALHTTHLLHEASFWSTLVRDTFRVPNQPVVQHDGERWQKLYRRLLTQSRVMTWGNNEKSCLGHSFVDVRRMQHHNRGRRRNHISWPGEMNGTRDLGVVSDLQCGGWSTTLLTSNGALYTVGVMDGLEFRHQRPPYQQQPKMSPLPLRFPPGYAQPRERYDAATATRQFSSGRAHVLAVSDSGKIWTWQNIDHAGMHVRFIHHETVANCKRSGRGVVKKVVAGWNKSAALIEGSGIVVWEPLRRQADEPEIEDAALVLESAVVPKTNYHATKSAKKSASSDEAHATTIGEVLSFVVLEAVILLTTSLGKLYVSQIYWSNTEQRMGEPVEIPLPGTSEDEAFATDVQGSYHNFAVFTRSGAVLTSIQDRLMELARPGTDLPATFTHVPALQNRNVISVAFGDYHFHALHSPGYITSYGYEPQACGALGLGGSGDPEGRLRGIRYSAMTGDGHLVPHAYTEGRRVWFETGKRHWLQYLTSGGADAEEAAARMRVALGSPDTAGQGELSEWVEQQGRDWESKFGLDADNEDGLGAYFALSVTAAGWHSGALVLVNDDLAQKISKACEVPDESPANSTALVADAASSSSSQADIQAEQVSLLARTFNTALDYGRWFLGVAPYDGTAVQSNNGIQTGPAAQNGTRHDFDPVNYGAAPREGVEYVWARDHFPRLRLSDGREMPGNVEFDEWRFGRPEWDLDFGL